MPYLKCNGVKLYYEVGGTGPAVLLLHGNGVDLHFFDALAQRLQTAYTVYRLDSRGHGKSEKTAQLDYFLMMRDTAAFIEALAIPRPALIGSSDGGNTGLLLSMEYPDLLSCLIPCGANLSVAGYKKWFYWMYKLGYLKTRSPLFRMVVKQADFSPLPLETIKAPVLVMAGSRDIVTEPHTRALAGAIPGAACCILPGQTHTSYLKKPDVFTQYVEGFLGRHTRGTIE